MKMPSVSADAAYLKMLLKLEVVKLSLEKSGDFVEICETDGYPIVYGEK
jgi:hypothetical protein